MMRDARHSSEMATMINRGGVAGVVAWWWWLFGAFGCSLGLKCATSRGAESKIHHSAACKRCRSHFVCSSQDFGPLYAGLVVGMRESFEWPDPDDTTTGPCTDHRKKQTGAKSEPRQW